MKKLFLVLAATLICGACLFTSCKKDKTKVIQYQWITDYEKDGFDPVTDSAYNHVVEVYEFFDDGSGYYEYYQANDLELVNAYYVRGENGDFTYTMSGDQVTVTLDDGSLYPTKLTYANNTLTDPAGRVFVHSDDTQKILVSYWYEEWHGGAAWGAEISGLNLGGIGQGN